VNLAADVAGMLADPRIRHSTSGGGA
jgi:hypothetical protein